MLASEATADAIFGEVLPVMLNPVLSKAELAEPPEYSATRAAIIPFEIAPKIGTPSPPVAIL